MNFFPFQKKFIYDSFINTQGLWSSEQRIFFLKEGFLGLCFSREMNTCYTFDFDLKP